MIMSLRVVDVSLISVFTLKKIAAQGGAARECGQWRKPARTENRRHHKLGVIAKGGGGVVSGVMRKGFFRRRRSVVPRASTQTNRSFPKPF